MNATVQNGVLNRNGNDGTITRFGWKAQNKSLLLFAGEASNVEMGMTNEIFQNERTPGTNCATNPLTEDNTHTAFPTGLNPQDVDTFVSSASGKLSAFSRVTQASSPSDSPE